MNNEDLREEELKALQQAMQEDADAIEIPDSLSPEAIKDKLEKEQKEKKGKILPMRRFAEVAAACAALAILTGIGGNFLIHKEDKPAPEPVLVGEKQETQFTHEKTVGDMYILASNYEDVYNSIEYRREYVEPDRDWIGFNGGNGFTYGGTKGNYYVEDTDIVYETATTETATTNSTVGHSTTNLQVEGVDESDIVKTDGSYIYIAHNNSVTIVDIRGDKMKEIATILPEMRASDSLRELYVDGDKLYVICENVRNNIRKTSGDSNLPDTMVSTILFTYDIADRTNPTLLGQAEVEGYYKESRKVDDYIYLFTTRGLWNLTEDNKDQVIPYVQEKLFPEDCIYIREAARCEFIMVSIDVKAPNDVVDQIMVVNNNASVYMGSDSIYLYNENYYDYGDVGIVTEIAKFTYKDGKIDAAGANSVRGTVEDTFAISEKNGYFRILTTQWNNGRSNNLFVLDSQMKLVGQLDDIAPRESIYAARYVGDYVYFITYRNTDPLFIVDMTDQTKPRIVSELEISGFSDYLQMYGQDKLLGIGYETEGSIVGGKLVMFNVEDKANPIIQAVEVDDRMMEIPGTYLYKQILADPDKNLIGFVYQSYSRYTPHYTVYRFEDDSFKQVLDIELENEQNETAIRGMYAGDYYYVIGSATIQAFDMENGFEEVDMLTY